MCPLHWSLRRLEEWAMHRVPNLQNQVDELHYAPSYRDACNGRPELQAVWKQGSKRKIEVKLLESPYMRRRRWERPEWPRVSAASCFSDLNNERDAVTVSHGRYHGMVSTTTRKRPTRAGPVHISLRLHARRAVDARGVMLRLSEKHTFSGQIEHCMLSPFCRAPC